MKGFKATKSYVLSMSVLSVFACNMPTAAVADPGALGSATSFGVFGGGAGMTNQGLFTVINGNIGTTAATTAGCVKSAPGTCGRGIRAG